MQTGRYWSINMSMGSLTTPVSLAIAGPVADITGVRPFWFATATVTVVIILMRRFMPDMYYVEERSAQAAAPISEPGELQPALEEISGIRTAHT